MSPIWPISQIKRKLEERKAKYKEETPADKAARRTATATVWIAAFTVVLAIVGSITLYEVYEGGADTHDLAVAAKEQAGAAKALADSTKDLADRMKDQAERTRIISEQAVVQAKAAQSQARASIDQVAKLEAGVKETHALANAARDSLEVTRENFIKDQAPVVWVAPQDVKLEEGKRLLWDIQFSNFGRSTAFQLRSCFHLEFGITFQGTALSRVQAPSLQTCAPIPTILPSGDKQYTTLFGANNLSASDILAINTIVGLVVVTVILEYEDKSGHFYRTTFCGYRTLGGGIATCPNSLTDIVQLK
jgi:hypothetical protein